MVVGNLEDGDSSKSEGSDVEMDDQKSGSPMSHRSGSPASQRSGSPHSVRSASRSPARSRSGSPASQRSRSGSPASRRSGSESPARSRSGSPVSQRSGSPGSHRSGSPGSHRSGSPGSQRSRSGSPASQRSRSRSGSTASHRSHSGSPETRRSRSRSPSGSKRSRSRSQSGSNRSRSRSRSGSPASKRSGSGSPASRRSGSESPKRKRLLSFGSDDAGSGSEKGSPKRKASDDSDSDGDIGRRPKKRKIVDSDDDDGSGNEKTEGAKASAGDLFGDADDISSDEEEDGKSSPRVKRMGDDVEGEEGEKDEEKEEGPPPEVKIEVEIPRVTTKLGKMCHFVKLPNFLSVETRPFDQAYYEDEIDEDEVLDEEGRTRMKLKVENTVRWRQKKDEEGNPMFDENGVPLRESNTRIVRWSDGSLSLHLGNEIFDVHTMLIQNDYNHLFIRQGTGLQGQGIFKTKLSFRPHSTDSFTHRKMTLSLADKSSKTQKIRVLPIAGKDPESSKADMIKKEEEKLRAAVRRESQQRRVREKSHSRGISSSYLEGDYDNSDDENAISIASIKNQYKQNKKDTRPIYSSSSDEESDSGKGKRLENAKNQDSDEDSDTEVKKRRARVLESDDEDED